MGLPYTEEWDDDIAPWFHIVQDMLDVADITINGSRPFDIRVTHPGFFKRVLREGSLGLGESYMDGWWECERLDMFSHRVLRAGLEAKLPRRLHDLTRVALSRVMNPQSRRRAQIVGKAHYDLGNDLFTLMLDPYMQYSCAYWKQAQTLEQAQEDKLAMICEKLPLKSGMTLLDIGCGWGGLAEFAARHYGVPVYGVTISREQQMLAQQRRQNLNVTIDLQDYRDLDRQFDCVVSVGMFEHVGPRNYDRFRRMFSYYLNLCAGAFRARTLQLWQVVFSLDGIEGGIRVSR
ncbi:CFA synthase, cdfA, cfa [Pectobacterium sp. F1-1]|uniref:class I SAM-dependent methyltransferase n=1 Tax=Pectobacterium sp. F1-1 TaxID=2949614 RepID=UPI0021D7C07B|nr:class I SAM-dependent methyltransferase [Pectobacterium sp. F1-1]UYA60728.1 CFA synthase, cdfA, cfa [Pectobacterium sp. F1-1]